MKLELSTDVDVAYVRFTDDEVSIVGTRWLDSYRFMDLDEAGNVVGIELILPRRGVDLADLPRRDEVAALLEKHNIPMYA